MGRRADGATYWDILDQKDVEKRLTFTEMTDLPSSEAIWTHPELEGYCLTQLPGARDLRARYTHTPIGVDGRHVLASVGGDYTVRSGSRNYPGGGPGNV